MQNKGYQVTVYIFINQAVGNNSHDKCQYNMTPILDEVM